MKLELKHLAPYLPYDLKCEILDYKCDYVGEQYLTLKGYYLIGDSPYFNFHAGKDFAGKNTNNFKPILRPMDDITTNIGNDTNNLSYSAYLKLYIKEDVSYAINMTLGLSYDTLQQLFEWHFDVFGLIEKNLAIDINTLNKQI